MDIRNLVSSHYGRADISATVLSALAGAGIDTSRLTPADLAPVDQLHAGGAPATQYLLDRLGLTAGIRLLDVGCGIGGTARMAASAYDAWVTGIDLTPEFVHTARELTDLVGLADRATFEATSGEALPFENGSFDRATMIHVGMNIADKAAVFAEVRRTLAPGGIFGVFEQMRTGDGPLPYPLPWAEDERSSFVASPEEYAKALTAAGFALEATEDRTRAVAAQPPETGSLSPAVIFGPGFNQRIDNNIAAARAGQLGTVLMLARA